MFTKHTGIPEPVKETMAQLSDQMDVSMGPSSRSQGSAARPTPMSSAE